jgi:hypothetical protein
MRSFGFVDRLHVDTVAHKPGPVVTEIQPHRPHEDRIEVEASKAECDVRRHSPASNLQVVDEERNRQIV